MSDTEAANRRFAHRLFTVSGDDEDQDVDVEQERPADTGLDAQRRFAAVLFAPDDPDAGILAGLSDGRTVGRTTPPRRDETPNSEFRFS
jgi:hypothetical protein